MSILETVARNLPLQAGAERHHRIVRLVMAFVGMSAVGVKGCLQCWCCVDSRGDI